MLQTWLPTCKTRKDMLKTGKHLKMPSTSDLIIFLALLEADCKLNGVSLA